MKLKTVASVLLIFVISVLLLVVVPYASAQATIYSTQSGDWKDINTWDGGVVPGTTETAVMCDGHIVLLNDNRTVFKILINATAELRISGVVTFGDPVAWTVTLSFDDTSGAGFHASSAGTLLAQGDVTNGVTITTADATPPPTNKWSGPNNNMIITATYTTLSYAATVSLGKSTSSITNSALNYNDQNRYQIGSGSITFDDNTIDSCTYGFQGFYAYVNGFFDNIAITNSVTYDIQMQATADVRIEFTNSNFDTSKVSLSAGNIISKTHNDIANNYKIIATTLSKSSITNDFTSTDNIEMISGTFTIDEDAASNNFYVQSGTILSQNTATTWTVTSLANVTINGSMESSGIMTSIWNTLFVNYGAQLWLNSSTIDNSDIIISFPYSIGASNYGAVDELNITQPAGADNHLNITQRDFSVKGSGTVLTFTTNNSASVNTGYNLDNLTTGEAYNVDVNGTTEYTITAVASAISFSYTSEGIREIEIVWTANISANDPPIITNKIVEETWVDGVPMVHQWNSTDADAELHTWTMGGDPGYLTLEQDNRTAWINGTCNDPGSSHSIYLNVTDGTDSDQEIWILHCVRVPGGSVSSDHLYIDIDIQQIDYQTFNIRAELDGTDPPFFYDWELGDGTRSKSKNLNHQYEIGFELWRDFDVHLTVKDNLWREAEADTTIRVINWPLIIFLAMTISISLMATIVLIRRV